MTKRILVDAANPEEVRVAITSEDRIDEFEVETLDKAQLRGNIYVAEVTRVEPSLQAAFINYGANRNGFLAFSEIHPMCFSLEQEEKDGLAKELEDIADRTRERRERFDKRREEQAAARKAAKDAAKAERETAKAAAKAAAEKKDKDVEAADETPAEVLAADKADKVEELKKHPEDAEALDKKGMSAVLSDYSEEDDSNDDDTEISKEDARALAIACKKSAEGEDSDKLVDDIPDDAKLADETPTDEEEEKEERKLPIHRRYNIADVVKEGQKILIQVVKEERGNKGAALTTYISLPGRFTVLMPNTPYAGGISRKISDSNDRRELKAICDNLSVPNGMGMIVRTAGVGQDATAIQRDIDNLLGHWTDISTAMDKTKAPNCVYEEGNVIMRSLRDMFTDDVSEVLISGRRQYRTAKDYMKQMMPESAKCVKEHRGATPIFSHYGVEKELLHLHRTRVELPSGGYLILNPTEALVSVDVNSGRATQERNIEETAFKTNIEAAEELARQLRLRDLAGLIVVDFIDMEDRRNERAVEKSLRKAIRRDRARIQVGGISNFGLLEMSRQRLRPSLRESTFVSCKHCNGSGMTPSISAAALMVLRTLEEENAAAKADKIVITVHSDLAIYLLNYKKDLIGKLEDRHKFKLLIHANDVYESPDFKLELVRVQANGSEKTQTIEVLLREQQELPPEKRGRKRRRNRKPNEKDNSETRSHDKNDNKKQANKKPRKNNRKPKDDKDSPVEDWNGMEKAENVDANSDDKQQNNKDDKPKRRTSRSPNRRPRRASRDNKPTESSNESQEKPSESTSKSATPDSPSEAQETAPAGKRRGRPRRNAKKDAGKSNDNVVDMTKAKEGTSEKSDTAHKLRPRKSATSQNSETAATKEHKPARKPRNTKPQSKPVETKGITVEKIDAQGSKSSASMGDDETAGSKIRRWWSKTTS